ncbi:hypothetical protein WBG99_33505 [Streptomyces sp. TG1A-60]
MARDRYEAPRAAARFAGAVDDGRPVAPVRDPLGAWGVVGVCAVALAKGW